ncbi:Major facilitator superfamily protein [Euphorbia peplus]|nr:Major facilitator superfamily protein [Euphorbia peplus]
MDNKEQGKTSEDSEQQVINYGGTKAMPFIYGNEIFECIGTVGLSVNLVVYLTTVFNIDSVKSTAAVNIFTGTANLATLLGAFLSDTYFGRFKCLCFGSVASFLGVLVIWLTATIPNLHPPNCAVGSNMCLRATTWQMGLLVSGLALAVIGSGGIRPCNLAFGADQFNPNTESGKKSINSFFNWFNLIFTIAIILSATVVVYVQSDVSWSFGLAIPTFSMFLACIILFLGTRIFVMVKPQASPLTSVAQVLVAAANKTKLQLPRNLPSSLFNFVPPKSINSRLHHTDQFRFLDKAAIVTRKDKINLDGSPANPWRLCSVQQVEEVKCWVRIIPIWISTIIFYMPLIQQQTYAVLQAFQVDRHLGTSGFQVPAATYTIFTMLTTSIWIPLYDRIIVPRLERLTGKAGGISLLQRMGIGFSLSIVCMLVSGWVEGYRRHIAVTSPTIGIAPKGGSISSMSGMWLVPQLALAGLSQAFSYVAQIEFYYKQFPENMRSTAQSFFYSGIAVSNYLSGFLISVVHQITSGSESGDWLAEDLNRGKLDYYYYMIAGFGILDFMYFLLCAKWYKYKRVVEMDTQPTEFQEISV